MSTLRISESGSLEARCPEDEHELRIEAIERGRMLRIEGPSCTAACLCCQRRGSFDHAIASLFIPGRT